MKYWKPALLSIVALVIVGFLVVYFRFHYVAPSDLMQQQSNTSTQSTHDLDSSYTDPTATKPTIDPYYQKIIDETLSASTKAQKQFPKPYSTISEMFPENSILSIDTLPADSGEFYIVKFIKNIEYIKACSLDANCSYSEFSYVGIFQNINDSFIFINPPEGYKKGEDLNEYGYSNFENLYSNRTFAGVLINKEYSGAGVALEFDIFTLENGKFVKNSMTQRNFPKRYVYKGYNGIKITKQSGNSIIKHIVPGYSETSARCCPDLPTANIFWEIINNKIVYLKTEFEK